MSPQNIRKVIVLNGILLVCGILFFAGHCLAQNSLVAADLINVGKEFYNKGSYDKAIHELSKALLIEPRNEEALDYLRRMGLKRGIYSYQTSPLDEISELTDEIGAYEKRLKDLEEQQKRQRSFSQKLQDEKQQLEQLIDQKEQEKQQLMEQHEELRIVASMKLKEQQEQIRELAKNDQARTEQVVTLHTDLYSLKDQLKGDREQFLVKKQELEQIRNEFEQYKKEAETTYRQVEIDREKQLLVLEKERDGLEHVAFNMEQDRREKVKAFEDIVRQKDAELYLEKNRTATVTYQLAKEKQHGLNLKTQVERLRQEKDELAGEARGLEAQLSEMRKQKMYRYAGKETKRDESIPLVNHIIRQDNIILDLKSRLIVLKEEVKSLNARENATEVAELNEQIESLRKEINEKEKALEFSGEKEGILESRIQEYRKRLEIVEGMIKDKENRILFLEEQMDVGLYSDPDPVFAEEDIQ